MERSAAIEQREREGEGEKEREGGQEGGSTARLSVSPSVLLVFETRHFCAHVERVDVNK